MTEQTQGKGRPTPKRSQKPKQYVAPPPTDRKEAAKQLRAKNSEKRASMRKGIRAGNEASFLPRDRGPVRALVRDVVDSNRSLGWVLMPGTVLVLLSQFGGQALYADAFLLEIVMLVVCTFDFVRTSRRVKAALAERFPKEAPRGHVFYAIQRTTLARRFRTPKPRVQLGDPV